MKCHSCKFRLTPPTDAPCNNCKHNPVGEFDCFELAEPKVVSVEEIRVKQGIHAGREYGVGALEIYGAACDKNGQRRRDADYKQLKDLSGEFTLNAGAHGTFFEKSINVKEWGKRFETALQNIKPLED